MHTRCDACALRRQPGQTSDAPRWTVGLTIDEQTMCP